jgi:hypothetical protein
LESDESAGPARPYYGQATGWDWLLGIGPDETSRPTRRNYREDRGRLRAESEEVARPARPYYRDDRDRSRSERSPRRPSYREDRGRSDVEAEEIQRPPRPTYREADRGWSRSEEDRRPPPRLPLYRREPDRDWPPGAYSWGRVGPRGYGEEPPFIRPRNFEPYWQWR